MAAHNILAVAVHVRVVMEQQIYIMKFYQQYIIGTTLSIVSIFVNAIFNMLAWNMLIEPSGLVPFSLTYINWVAIQTFLSVFLAKGSATNSKTQTLDSPESYLTILSGWLTKIMMLIVAGIISLIIY